MAGCHKLTVFSEERRVIDGKEHRHCRLVDSNCRQRFRLVCIGNRFTDLEAFYADNSADITGLDGIHLCTSQTFKYVDFLNLGFHHRAVAFTQHDILTFTQFTTMYAAYGDTAYIFGIV